MQSILVNYSDFIRVKRWDFDFFDPEYLDVINQVKQSGWIVKTLSEIVLTLTDGQHGYLEHTSTGIPLLRTTNVFENEIKMDDVRYIAPEVHAEIKRSQLKPEDVLLTTIGTIGIAAVVDNSIGEANINQNLVKLTPKPEVNPYYLALFLNSRIGKIQIQRTASKSVVPIVNYLRLRNILVPLPPREIQDHIAKAMGEAYAESNRLRVQADILVNQSKESVERIILGQEDVT
ncbi:restriction endonuclease subunit S [Nostoc sp. CHAB 5824]|nr:restriction endonuclease subunit S [Nostoc sp. CHAB 5824]